MKEATYTRQTYQCEIARCMWKNDDFDRLNQHELAHREAMKVKLGETLTILSRNSPRGVVRRIKKPTRRESSYKVPYFLVEYEGGARVWFSMMDIKFGGLEFHTIVKFD
ncbi:hypothetical protein LCGC14_1028810 [marine sediment metagenome]|uniref:Uncharacterized protein n=1 Tax=marine sediment metagenome TaxID=412755 RepID=A0A0F9R147_9ZZZZ